MKNTRKIKDLLFDLDWMFGTAVFDRELLYVKEDEEGKIAQITVEEDYQRITIRLYPLFFTKDLVEQRKDNRNT